MCQNSSPNWVDRQKDLCWDEDLSKIVRLSRHSFFIGGKIQNENERIVFSEHVQRSSFLNTDWEYIFLFDRPILTSFKCVLAHWMSEKVGPTSRKKSYDNAQKEFDKKNNAEANWKKSTYFSVRLADYFKYLVSTVLSDELPGLYIPLKFAQRQNCSLWPAK